MLEEKAAKPLICSYLSCWSQSINCWLITANVPACSRYARGWHLAHSAPVGLLAWLGGCSAPALAQHQWWVQGCLCCLGAATLHRPVCATGVPSEGHRELHKQLLQLQRDLCSPTWRESHKAVYAQSGKDMGDFGAILISSGSSPPSTVVPWAFPLSVLLSQCSWWCPSPARMTRHSILVLQGFSLQPQHRAPPGISWAAPGASLLWDVLCIHLQDSNTQQLIKLRW